jgi:hypothetical protein
MTKLLQRPTLVLNRNWQPVNVASVARALVLVWNDSAKVVDPDDYRLYTWADWSLLAPRDGDLFIQAIRQRLRVPEVIALAAYDRLPSAAVSFSRRNIFKRVGKPRDGRPWALHECAPGRASGLQNRCTGFDSSHSCLRLEDCRRGST